MFKLKNLLNIFVYYLTYILFRLSGFHLNKFKIVRCADSLGKPIRVYGANGHSAAIGLGDFFILNGHLKGVLKRQINIRFRRKYVFESLAYRRGVCDRCGLCCVERKCPFIVKNGEFWDCMLHPHKPLNCIIYPIDRKDLDEYGCKGFYYDPSH